MTNAKQKTFNRLKTGKDSANFFMWEDVIKKYLSCDKCKYGQINTKTGRPFCPYYHKDSACRSVPLIRRFLKNASEIVTYENFLKLMQMEILRKHAADLEVEKVTFDFLDKVRDLHKMKYGDKHEITATIDSNVSRLDMSGLITEASKKAKEEADEIIEARQKTTVKMKKGDKEIEVSQEKEISAIEKKKEKEVVIEV